MSMRILVADDKPKVRFALRVLLGRQPESYIIDEAADAVEVLVQVMNTCPDMVLLAWDLPGLDELKLVGALQRICPKVDIIALSGRSEARREAIEAGVDAFVSKGDPPEQLLAAIKRCISEGPAKLESGAAKQTWKRKSGVSPRLSTST